MGTLVARAAVLSAFATIGRSVEPCIEREYLPANRDFMPSIRSVSLLRCVIVQGIMG